MENIVDFHQSDLKKGKRRFKEISNRLKNPLLLLIRYNWGSLTAEKLQCHIEWTYWFPIIQKLSSCTCCWTSFHIHWYVKIFWTLQARKSWEVAAFLAVHHTDCFMVQVTQHRQQGTDWVAPVELKRVANTKDSEATEATRGDRALTCMGCRIVHQRW